MTQPRARPLRRTIGVPLVAGVGEETAVAPLTFALVALALVALFTDLGGVASLIGSAALRFWTTGDDLAPFVLVAALPLVALFSTLR